MPCSSELIGAGAGVLTTLAVAFIAAGAFFDKMILPDYRGPVYKRLRSLWITVERTPLRDLARDAASGLDKAVKKHLPARICSLRAFVFWIVLSYFLTTFAALLDYFVLEPGVHPEVSTSVPLPVWTGYVANWVFDLLIFLIALKILEVAASSPRRWVIVGAMAKNLVAAAVLYVGCITLAIVGYEAANELRLPGTVKPVEDRTERLREVLSKQTGRDLAHAQLEHSAKVSLVESFECAIDSIELLAGKRSDDCGIHYRVWVTENGRTERFETTLQLRRNFTVPVTCATVFAPTIALSMGLLVLMLLKMSLEPARWIYKIFLRRAVERGIDEPAPEHPDTPPKAFAPGTLLGMTLSLLSALFAVVGAMAKYSSVLCSQTPAS
jgi:hypothetical protein